MKSLAAVDLGSNSFHMVIARLDRDRMQIVDRLREPVRLAFGLQTDGTLDEVSRARALECLARFGQRLRDLEAPQVRAVGTNTLRKAANAKDFLRDASEALGHHIEIIPGREEARLIYLGVSHGVAGAPARRLVVDIGGGSTEAIIGDSFDAVNVHSMFMGCVSYTKKFFADGKLSRKRLTAAKLAARLEMQPIDNKLREQGWERAIGASGTIRSIADIIREAGWGRETISAAGLARIERVMLQAGRMDRLELPGLEQDRRPVFPGGFAILSALFESLDIDEMWVSPTALREGLLYQMVGRIHDEDPRDRTIHELRDRYSIDKAHADRVQETALGLLGQVKQPWNLELPEAGHVLAWAAELHELGLAVNYTGHHKHGAYLVAASDLPGFSRDEQLLIATLIRGHRRKLAEAYFDELPAEYKQGAIRLCVILRLAVLLNRHRDPETVPLPVLEVDGQRIELNFDEDWLEAHPLVRADLVSEQRAIKALGFRLSGFDHGD